MYQRVRVLDKANPATITTCPNIHQAIELLPLRLVKLNNESDSLTVLANRAREAHSKSIALLLHETLSEELLSLLHINLASSSPPSIKP